MQPSRQTATPRADEHPRRNTPDIYALEVLLASDAAEGAWVEWVFDHARTGGGQPS